MTPVMLFKPPRKIFGEANIQVSAREMQNVNEDILHKIVGASEGIRTLDTHVGNVMLYQAELRSLPKARKNYGNSLEMQALFFVIQA